MIALKVVFFVVKVVFYVALALSAFTTIVHLMETPRDNDR